MSGSQATSTVSYNFELDAAGVAPANITSLVGSLVVTNTGPTTSPALLGNFIHDTSATAVTLNVYDFNWLAPSQADQTLTWRRGQLASRARDGFMLRSQPGTTVSGFPGLRQGYLFQTSAYGTNSLKIFAVGGTGMTLIGSVNQPMGYTYYKAEAIGTTLRFSCSPDGVTWTIAASVLDSTFADGRAVVQYTNGLTGTQPSSAYVDEVALANAITPPSGNAVSAPALTPAASWSASWDFGDPSKLTLSGGVAGSGAEIISVAGSDGTTYTLPRGASGRGPKSVYSNGRLVAQFDGMSQYMQVASDLGLNVSAQATIITVFEATGNAGYQDIFDIGNTNESYANQRWELQYGTGPNGFDFFKSDGGGTRPGAHANPDVSGYFVGPRCIICRGSAGSAPAEIFMDGQAVPMASTSSGTAPAGINACTIGATGYNGVSGFAAINVSRILVSPQALTNAQVAQAFSWAFSQYNCYGAPMAAKAIQRPVITSASASTQVTGSMGQVIGYPLPTSTIEILKNGVSVASAVGAVPTYTNTANGDTIVIRQTPNNSNGSAGSVSSIPVKVGQAMHTPVVNGIGVVGSQLTLFIPDVTGVAGAPTVTSYQWYKNIVSKNNLVGQQPWSTAAQPTVTASEVGYIPSCTVTLSDGTIYSSAEFGNSLPYDATQLNYAKDPYTPGLSPMVPQKVDTAPTTATRPAGNTGSSFFTRYGRIYDTNGNQFKIRGFNVCHTDTIINTGAFSTGANLIRTFDEFNVGVFSSVNTPLINKVAGAKAVHMPTLNYVVAQFTGSVSSNVLTAASMASGRTGGYFCIGQTVSANGNNIGRIIGFKTGTGTTGDYYIKSITGTISGNTLTVTSVANNVSLTPGTTQLGGPGITQFTLGTQLTNTNAYNVAGHEGTYHISGSPQNVATDTAMAIATAPSAMLAICRGTDESDPSVLAAAVSTWIYQATDWQSIDTHSIINILNEWGPSASANNTVWRDSYITQIQRMRAAGFLGCIAIDAPGSGQDKYAFLNHAAAILAADPQKNVIFSQHMYGFFCVGQAYPYLKQLSDLSDSTGLCFIVGEFGAGSTVAGVGSFTNAEPMEIVCAAEAVNLAGWMAWAFDDHVNTSVPEGNGYYSFVHDWYNGYSTKDSADLTWFGVKMIKDPVRGLESSAVKATIFP